MSAMASQITSFKIVYSTVYSRRRSKKTPMLRVTGLSEPVAGEFPAQRASNAENFSIWWRHDVKPHAVLTMKDQHTKIQDMSVICVFSSHSPTISTDD